MYMFGVTGETHAHDYFEVISFYNSKQGRQSLPGNGGDGAG